MWRGTEHGNRTTMQARENDRIQKLKESRTTSDILEISLNPRESTELSIAHGGGVEMISLILKKGSKHAVTHNK